jgi:tRNA(Ile)-lysidine synthase
VAEQVGAAAVLLGHTLDDQAETVLLGLARGSGARSLAGMAPVVGRYRRPLLGLRRAEVRQAAAGLATVDDAHNDDRRFARARVRHDALPAVEQALGPGIAEALARTADLLRADAAALEAWAAEVVASLGKLSAHRVCAVPFIAGRGGGAREEVGVEVGEEGVARLRGLPEAVRRRVLRRLAVAAGVPAGALSYAHTVALDRLLVDPRMRGPVALPGGVLAERCRDLSPGRGGGARVGSGPGPGSGAGAGAGAGADAGGGAGVDAASASSRPSGCGRLRLHRGARPAAAGPAPPADPLVE